MGELSNTTIGMLMASIDMTIVLIAMSSIFRGIQIDPFTSFQYLLWIMVGYSIVTATLLVTFGRLSDIYGRVKLYNLGFAIFTVGSILLFLTPNTGNAGAMELIASESSKAPAPHQVYAQHYRIADKPLAKPSSLQ